MLLTDKTRLLFFGDPLQRIYGFIGAIPNIMDITKEKFNLWAINYHKEIKAYIKSVKIKKG